MKSQNVPIFWTNEIIGYVHEMKVDMFDWYGKWFPENNLAYQDFEAALHQTDEIQVQIGLAKGTRGYVSSESFYEDEINIKVR